MALIDAWRALWGGDAPQAEQRGLISDAGGFSGLVGTGQASPRSRQQLLQAIGETPALMAAQTRVSNDVARLKWSFFLVPRGSPIGIDGIRSEIASMSADGPAQSRAIRGMLTSATPDLQPYTGDLVNLWRKPCPGLTANSWRWVVSSQQDLSGESVLWIRNRDAQGLPLDMWPIPAHWLDASDPGRMSVTFPGGRRETVKDPARDLMRYRRPHPANPWGAGLGVAEALNNELSTDEAASQLTYARYQNGGVPNWVIGMPGASKDVLNGVRAAWRNMFSGPRRKGGVFWGDGDIKAQKLDESIADLGVDGQRKFMREVIWTTYGVPPEALGLITASNRATAKEASNLLAKGCIAPRAAALCDFVQESVVPQFDDPERVLVVVENPIPEDLDFQLEAFKAAPHTVSRDEWRGVQSQGPGTGPDVYYVPDNVTPVAVGSELSLADAKEAAKPAAKAPPKEPEPDPTGTDDDEGGEDDTRAVIELVPQMRAADNRIQAIVDELEPERLSKPVGGLWSRELRTWVASELAATGVAISFDLINPLLTRHLAEFAGDRIPDINETTKDQLRKALTAGVREGEDITKLSARVSKTFDAAKTRATMIARTEVLRSSNWGTLTAHKMSGVVAQREWVATADERTRDAHHALDGQVVGIEQPFTVPSGEYTGREADHPGGFGVAALDINCRCTQAAVIDDPLDGRGIRALTADERVKVWEDYVRAIGPWESQAEGLFAAAFRAQEKLVQRKLRERFGHELAG